MYFTDHSSLPAPSSCLPLVCICTDSLTLALSHSASVKYIKEMSAFFKSSGSPGAALPWDSPPSTPQRGTELSPAELKEPRSIPLKMCQVSRKQCPPDTENRYCTDSYLRFDDKINQTDPRLKMIEREFYKNLCCSHILFINIWNFLFTLKLLFCCDVSLVSLTGLFSHLLAVCLLAPLPLSLISSARYFEVIASNRKNSVFLRAKDPAMAQSWYNAIQAGTASLLPRVKEEMKSMQSGMEVKHLGWITEQVCERTDTLHMVNIENISCLWGFSLNQAKKSGSGVVAALCFLETCWGSVVVFLRCVRAALLFLWCAGVSGSREASAGYIDWQRPAVIFVLARKQREPQQSREESPTHHHQVNTSSNVFTCTLCFLSFTNTHSTS